MSGAPVLYNVDPKDVNFIRRILAIPTSYKVISEKSSKRHQAAAAVKDW